MYNAYKVAAVRHSNVYPAGPVLIYLHDLKSINRQIKVNVKAKKA